MPSKDTIKGWFDEWSKEKPAKKTEAKKEPVAKKDK